MNIIGTPEKEEVEKSTEVIGEEMMTKNFPKLKKDIK